MLHARSLTILDGVFALLAVVLLKRFLQRRKTALPPGPRPLLGVLALPKKAEREWEVYGHWGDKWGEITSVLVFGQPIIILDSFKAASELLEKKSLIYSDRPVFQMCGELVGWSGGPALLSYGPRFKRSRKQFHTLFGSNSNLKKFQPIQTEESRKFLQQLLESPQQFRSHIHQSLSATALRIAYGYTLQGEDDPTLSMVTRVMEEFSQAITPGAFLVDLLPTLKHVPSWMPGAGFKRKAKLWASHLTEMLETPYKFVEDQMAQGTAEDSFVSLLLQEGLAEEEIPYVKWNAGGIFGAAVDTTEALLSRFFLQMALHPEIQATARAELDRVVGNERLPTFGDRERLPYVEALCKELFRYHPIGPMGLPHCAMEDGFYNGYFIPKGSIILANIWKMAHNPDVYVNPMIFNPSRFILSDKHTPEPDPREMMVFGFGRRVCPGKLLAESSVFLTVAHTLATFTISKATKEDGTFIEPVEDYLPGTISQVAPFLCCIKPRSAEATALIQN